MTEIGLQRPLPESKRMGALPSIAILVALLAAAALTYATVTNLVLPDPYLDGATRAERLLTEPGDRAFVAADGRFRAVFPAHPARDVERMPADGFTAKLVTYIAETGESAKAVSFFNLPKTHTFDLNTAANGAAAGTDSKLVRAKMTKHQGHEAVQYTAAGRGFSVQGLIVRTPRRVYQVLVVAPRGEPTGYRGFVDSFRIQK